jgi:hypothetical protein
MCLRINQCLSCRLPNPKNRPNVCTCFRVAPRQLMPKVFKTKMKKMYWVMLWFIEGNNIWHIKTASCSATHQLFKQLHSFISSLDTKTLQEWSVMASDQIRLFCGRFINMPYFAPRWYRKGVARLPLKGHGLARRGHELCPTMPFIAMI